MSTIDVSQGWDNHAATYARLAAPCTGYIAQNLFLTIAGRLPPGARVLDIACGNGELSRAALLHVLEEREAAGSSERIVAIDASAEMVDRTARGLRAIGHEDLFRCEVQDGQALTLPDGSFEAALSAFGIFLFPDRKAAWREVARVLVPGGLLATAVWRGPEHNALARLQMEPLLEALPKSTLERIPRASWLDIATAEGLTQEIEAAGFVDPEVTVFDAMLTAPTPAAMWAMMRENPMTGPVLAMCSDDEVAAVESAVRKRFEAHAGGPDRPVRFGASCHLLVARRG